ncbi:LuxR C-terminal-related transcriptional regulator [uncultured Cellulomonas sp.]|uniref:LuxR C-terminal-related transcriptional regulator n=1 Tax=uncultured Cellulomonas sp. TaxID=189682 RepID=UPI002610F907|nr:LuxR C-terminal-related transcriptional regulator [uncultured Cellulomonas sp.]
MTATLPPPAPDVPVADPATGGTAAGGGPAAALTAHPVLGRALSWVDRTPQAPLVLAICGTGGTGKSTALAALRAAYRAAGDPVVSVRGRAGVRPDDLAAAGSRPVLVDDAHLLPVDALEWLLERADDDATRLVLAHRPWPRPAPLADLVRELDARAAVVGLGALDRSGVAALAHHRLGRPAPASVVDAVVHLSAGVPRLADLLLTDAALSGAASPPTAGPTRPAPWPRAWPGSAVLAQVDTDLDAAGSGARAVVLALALGGTPEPAVLSPALGLAPDVVARSLQTVGAAGLLLADGSVVPVVAQALLAACPPREARAVVRALIRAGLDHGDDAAAVAARFDGHGGGPELVVALRDAAAAVGATDPARAADLLRAGLPTGASDPAAVVEQARYAALAGDLHRATALVDDVLAAASGPVAAAAASVATAVLAHRGQLATAAAPHRINAGTGSQPTPGTWQPRVTCPDDPAGEAAATVVLLGSGAVTSCLPGPGATATAPGAGTRTGTDGATGTVEVRSGPAPGATTRSCAQALLAQGLRESVLGDGRRCLATLSRASALVGGDGRDTLMADTPAALGALAALSAGEPGHAERLLHRAIGNGEGGPVAQPRHHLLLAWVAMVGGRCEEARARVAVARTAAGDRWGERDELVLRALEVGVARRSHDLGALTRAWPGAWQALLGHGLDLFMLLPLGELAVAAARLDRSHQVAAHLEEAGGLLARAGEPVLWATPLHWYGVRAAIVAERPESVAPHATALVRGAATSRHAAMLAEAGRVWVQVLAGRVEPAAVERVARRLHAAGLGWDGARLAAHAAAHTEDPRSGGRLLHVARDLRAGTDRAVTPAPVLPAVGHRRVPSDAAAPVASPRPSPTPASTAPTRAAAVPASSSAGPAAGTARGWTGAATPPAAPVRAAGGPPSSAREAAGTRTAPGRPDPSGLGDAAPEMAVHLSVRELEVARLVVAGHTYREISERLYISAKTVEHHMARMRQRLGLESRAALLSHLRARVATLPGERPEQPA